MPDQRERRGWDHDGRAKISTHRVKRNCYWRPHLAKIQTPRRDIRAQPGAQAAEHTVLASVTTKILWSRQRMCGDATSHPEGRPVSIARALRMGPAPVRLEAGSNPNLSSGLRGYGSSASVKSSDSSAPAGMRPATIGSGTSASNGASSSASPIASAGQYSTEKLSWMEEWTGSRLTVLACTTLAWSDPDTRYLPPASGESLSLCREARYVLDPGIAFEGVEFLGIRLIGKIQGRMRGRSDIDAPMERGSIHRRL